MGKILVPFELPDPEPLSEVLIDDLLTLEVVIIGHYAVPEQTPRDVARETFEEEAQQTLDELAQPFRDAGTDVTTRLVFGRERGESIDRVAIEEDCTAELNPAPTDGIQNILVPLPEVAEFERLPEFMHVLCQDSTKDITLLHVIEGEEKRERGEKIVEETRESLLDEFDPVKIDTLLVEGKHDDEILRLSEDYDGVVMYEASPRVKDRIFGTLSERIRKKTGNPVIIVRRDY